MPAARTPATSPRAVAASAIPTTAAPGAGQRLVSLDAYRGFVMLAMASEGLAIAHVAKKFPDSKVWQAVGYQFEHVPWVGCAAWDLIQPSFMFLVGVAMAYSYASRQARGASWGQMARHAAWRSLLLVALGVFLRSRATAATNFTFEDVLSQIGLGYFFLFLLWNRPPWLQFAAAVLLLTGDWLLFYSYPLPASGFDYPSVGVPNDWPYHLHRMAAHWDKNTNVAAVADHWLLGKFPFSSAYPFNRGGYETLNFVPSLATMIFGLLAGGLLRSGRSPGQKWGLLVAAGLAGLLLGWGLDAAGLCPIVKRIWTPSWTLFSTGWTLLILAGFYGVVDLLEFRRWTFPLVVVGMNSIVMYCLAELSFDWLARRLQVHLGPDVFTLWKHVDATYEPLIRCAGVLGLMWLVCYWLYRQKIFVKI
jgi:heparan-alpha-glucosaminide N-acetyltransferase